MRFDLNTVSNVDPIAHLGSGPFEEPYIYLVSFFVMVVVKSAKKNSYFRVISCFLNHSYLQTPILLSHYVFLIQF